MNLEKAMNIMDKEIKSSVKFKAAMNFEKAAIELRMAHIEAENEAIIAELEAVEEVYNTVNVLLDSVEHTEKPQGAEIARITKELVKHNVKITIPNFIQLITRGCSFKASILSGTTKDSFVSSNIVALDVDNKESYTSIDEFIKLTREANLEPLIIYHTFSSTKEHERFRVLYRFNKTITDPVEMDKLYQYIWSLFPAVDIDRSVNYDKILFGGKEFVMYSNIINKMPDLTNVSFISKPVKSATKKKEVISGSKHITPEQVKENISKLVEAHRGKTINAQYINTRIKLTDILEVEENQKFRCILPKHEDEHPSARIVVDKENPNEQVYMCSCSATGSRLIGVYAHLFNVSYVTAYREIVELLKAKTVNEYQKQAREYIDDLYSNFNYLVDDSLRAYLNKRNLTPSYLLLLRIAREKAVKPLTNNENDIAIFVSNSYMKERMTLEGLTGATNANIKLNELCRLGFIKKLSNDELTKEALRSAIIKTEKNGAKSRIDFYCIMDLTPARIDQIKSTIANDKAVGMRQKGINTQRQINVNGYDHIRENVHVQGYNQKSDNLVMKAVQSLIESGAKYFNEEDINKQIRKKNHSLNKKEAEQKILDFMPQIVQLLGLERTRVNKKTRKKYNISRREYASNSVVYIVSSNTEILDLIEMT